MLGDERNLGRTYAFNVRTEVNVENKNMLVDVQKYIKDTISLRKFIDREDVESIKLNYAKKKIDLLIRLYSPSKYRIRNDMVDKITMLVFKYFENSAYHTLNDEKYQKVLKYVNRKYSKITIRIDKTKVEELYNSLHEGIKTVIRDTNVLTTKSEYDDFIEMLTEEIRPLTKGIVASGCNKKWYARLGFTDAVKKVKETFNKGLQTTVKVTKAAINRCIVDKDFYKKYINNAKIVPFKVKNIEELKQLYIDYFRFSGRKDTKFFLFDVEPVLLNPDAVMEPENPIVASNRIKTVYKRLFRAHKKQIETDIKDGKLEKTMLNKNIIYKPTIKSDVWVVNAYKSNGLEQSVSTGMGIGLGQFYRRFAEYISTHIGRDVIIKFLTFSDDKNSNINVRPKLNEKEIVKHKNVKDFYQMIFLIIMRELDTENKGKAYEVYQKQKYGVAAQIGKEIWSYMTGEYLGISEVLADDVGGHGFSQYADRVAFTFVIPLTNKFFKQGTNRLNRFFSANELNKNYSADTKNGPTKLYGYFLKQLPLDAAKYYFNDEDNYNCPVTALTRQCDIIAVNKDEIMRIYLELGMFNRNDIRVSSEELPEFYSKIANYLKKNFVVRIYNIYKKNDLVKTHDTKYYFVGEKGYYAYENRLKCGKPMTNLNKAKTEIYINKTKKYKGVDSWEPFTVALCEGHVFNTNVNGSLSYLKRACEHYDTLADAPEIHNKMIDDIAEFLEKEDKLVETNPSYLLKNMTKREEYELYPTEYTKQELVELATKLSQDKVKKAIERKAIHPDVQKYKRKEQTENFMADFETVASSNITSEHDRVKFKSRNYDVSDTDFECTGTEDLSTVVPYSNCVLRFTYTDKDDIVEPVILDSLFTFDTEIASNTKLMLEWIVKICDQKVVKMKRDKRGVPIKSTGDVYSFIYFHNFASFDGPILMYDAMRHIDLLSIHPNVAEVFYPKKIEVSGKAISFDLTFKMKSGKKICLSFRDSYKIISTPVSALGSTFKIPVSKLKYPYGYYQYKFERKGDFKKYTPKLTVDQIEDDDDMLGDFENYVEENDLHHIDYYEQMLSYIAVKDGGRCNETQIRWKDIGIDYNDLEEIANGNVIRWKTCTKDFSYDKEIENQSKRMFTDEFIIQMAKIACGRASEVTECVKQVEELNNSSTGKVVMFDYLEFCRIYNWYDCYNVVEAMCKFQQHLYTISKIDQDVQLTNGEVVHINMKDVRKVNIFQHRTISSIAFNIGLRSGVMDGVAKLIGNTARFVNRKWGGKVFVNHIRDMFYSKHKDELDTYIDQMVTEANAEIVSKLLSSDYGSQIDLDINSFYPHGISIMKTPTGKPYNVFYRKGENIHLKIQKMLDQGLPFWVCCSYTSKYIYDMPENCCKVDGKNVWRNGKFTDTIIDDVKMRYLIEIGEVDLVEFKFKTSETFPVGVAFKTWNRKASAVMSILYDYRLANKANVGLATVVKAILNNIYGSSIRRENITRGKYIPTSTFNNYMNRNKHKTSGEVVSCGNYYEIKEYTTPCEYAIYPQFGSRVLSTSKTISGKYAWILSAVDGKLAEIRSNPDFKQPTELKKIVEWTLKHSKKWMSTDSYHIESYVSSHDTDSFNIPVQCLELMKPYISKKMGDLESDYDFKKYSSVPEMVKDPSWLIKNMQKSAVECYYCMPKTYTCKVMMTEKRGDNYYYVYRDHTRAKGVPKSCNPSFEDIKSLYFGNPIKFYTTIKGDSTLLSFMHCKGLGLGQKRATTVKEIMPYNLNYDKYYYAKGNVIEGHYKYGEKPIRLISDSKADNKIETQYYIYDNQGVLEPFEGDYLDLISTSDKIIRVGSDIKCGVYDNDEPVHILNSGIDYVDANSFDEFKDGEWSQYKIVRNYSETIILKV